MRRRSLLLAMALAAGARAMGGRRPRAQDPEPSPESVMVPMRDGVRLYTEVWKPPAWTAASRGPAVLTRGYGAGRKSEARAFTEAGYAYVGQSTRGHAGSEGEFDRFFPDAEDGYDTLTWLARQPWCDGNIAMYGRSYWAATQWLVAPLQHPNLKAIIPQNMNAELWSCVYRCNGALSLALTAWGRAIRSLEEAEGYGGLDAAFRHLPLIDLDEAVGQRRSKLWRDYVGHDTYDDFWRRIGIRGKYDRVRIPVFLMSGWYDYYPGAAFESYAALREVGASDEIRIVVNPSDHQNRVVGERPFGEWAGKDELALAIRWLDQVVRGIDRGLAEEPPISIFVMGINRWRYEREWPLARTRFTPYYFSSPQGARAGRLQAERPGEEPPSTYVYDPRDPVPTLGGNHSLIPPLAAGPLRPGALDQRPNEARADVLLFTSDPLPADLEVTGPVEVTLFAASSAPDTDFVARLVDVHPDGTAYNLTEGIIRARFRESIWAPPKPLVPGEVYRYRIALLPTSNVFRRGHRIRVQVTSSNFPLWDRNPNTGHPQGRDAELRVARQTIRHDATFPSHITLPVIPAR